MQSIHLNSRFRAALVVLALATLILFLRIPHAAAQSAQDTILEKLKKSADELNKRNRDAEANTPVRDPDKEACQGLADDDDETIKACDRAIKSGKYKGRELADLLHTRGLTHGSNGRRQLGTADFNAAIRADPTYAPAYAERGSDYLHERKFDLAINDFNEALRLGGEDTTTLFSRGLAYRAKGDRARAIADFRRVYQLNPDIKVAREVLKELGAEP